MPMRRRTPVMVVPRSQTYSSPRHDYGIEDSINRADFLSQAVLEDTYDAANRSRGKDKDLLRNVNSAIISTEVHENPKSAVVSRRVRASSVPPRATSVPPSTRPQQGYHAHAQKIKESVFARVPSTGSLHASRPPLPKPTERKAIRDVDGFTKPKNIMSWEHRLESRLNPDDIIYEPASLQRMRAQVKEVQEKMDRQRQLLDRYLDKDLPPTITSRAEGGPPATAGGDPDNRPMSELRRKLRRTLAKSKNNPEYYKE